ncbi:MAG: hypothetical protein JW744_04870 [Candidatus Diapherotrites archaeon]|uniref:Uncharacterized protein n=1 Tax=Candidatus Iainarchaeum sp. TaxID=3101447 RepID=A0A939CAH3_9ARCH|nr:hypothetical protein [Candidatus Diapherotrites archaeon]
MEAKKAIAILSAVLLLAASPVFASAGYFDWLFGFGNSFLNSFSQSSSSQGLLTPLSSISPEGPEEKLAFLESELDERFGKSRWEIESTLEKLQETALGKRYLGEWAKEELLGYCLLLDEFPEGRGNAVLNVMREAWHIDSAVKQAAELEGKEFKNFFPKGHPKTVIRGISSEKEVDAAFEVNPRTHYVSAAAFKGKVKSWKSIKNAVVREAKNFEFSYTGLCDNTIVIELAGGTSLSESEIRGAIWHAFEEKPAEMLNVARVGIYNAKQDSVILYTKSNWIWNY